MGSKSDLPVMQEAIDILKELEIDTEIDIVSAHRTPEKMFDYAKNAKRRGLKVIIAGAGGAAHLPGMIASITSIPVIGVPIKSKNSIDTNKPIRAQQDAMRPESTTTSILPINIFHLLTGVVKSVSIVPLSFSPEKRSIAGYMHPKNPNAIKI